MDTSPSAAERVPVRDHRHRRSTRAAALAVAALLLVAGCSSDGSDAGDRSTGNGSDDAAGAVDPLRAANQAYLLEIGYEREQASCVSGKVTVDLAELLSASDGAGTPTDKPGFDEFEAATKACIRADTELTTTTAPTG